MTYSPADIKLAKAAFVAAHGYEPVMQNEHNAEWVSAYLLAHTRQQAIIDELMWEWCPKEMTGAQIENYEFYQKAHKDRDERSST